MNHQPRRFNYQLGVVGFPLQHSLSPAMHRFWGQELGLSLQYEAYALEPKDFTPWLDRIFKSGEASSDAVNLPWDGFNVTIPHKQAVFQGLTCLSDIAQTVGAVNTVYKTLSGGWCGDNTDVIGFQWALDHHPCWHYSSQPLKVVVLGAGGASLAVLQALWNRSTESSQKLALLFLARDSGKAQHLTAAWQDRQKALTPQDMFTYQTLNFLSDQHLFKAWAEQNPPDLVVNTTPVGMMGPLQSDTPLPAEILMILPKTCLVYDLVYQPLETVLIQQAQQLGLPTQDGLDMLIAQGAAAFEQWTGKPVEVALRQQTRIMLRETVSVQ